MIHTNVEQVTIEEEDSEEEEVGDEQLKQKKRMMYRHRPEKELCIEASSAA